jgi:hypothetical protein
MAVQAVEIRLATEVRVRLATAVIGSATAPRPRSAWRCARRESSKAFLDDPFGLEVSSVNGQRRRRFGRYPTGYHWVAPEWLFVKYSSSVPA